MMLLAAICVIALAVTLPALIVSGRCDRDAQRRREDGKNRSTGAADAL